MKKNILLLFVITCSVSSLFSQTQKESLAAQTAKGNSTIGFDLGLGNPLRMPIFQQSASSLSIAPSLNYSYYLANRLSVGGSINTGFTKYSNRLSASNKEIGASVFTRYYPIKTVGFFTELEFEYSWNKFDLNRDIEVDNFSSQYSKQTTGLDVGWSWWLGKDKRILLEAQTRLLDFNVTSSNSWFEIAPSSTSIGIKYQLGKKKGF